jgi:hypothetical protein
MKVAEMAARLISQRSNQPFWDNAICSGVPMDQMLNEHLPWVRRHYTFIRWPDRSTQPPISWLIERVRENVIRTGAKLAVVDPWQEFDDEMPNWERNHSRYVGRVLQRFVGLAQELRVNIVLVVHPTKLKRDKDGKVQIPEGNEIADSVHFASRCDTGVTIDRANDQLDDMLLRVWKARNPRFAHYGDTVLRVDQHTHRIWPKPVEVGAGLTFRPHWANAD